MQPDEVWLVYQFQDNGMVVDSVCTGQGMALILAEDARQRSINAMLESPYFKPSVKKWEQRKATAIDLAGTWSVRPVKLDTPGAALEE